MLAVHLGLNSLYLRPLVLVTTTCKWLMDSINEFCKWLMRLSVCFESLNCGRGQSLLLRLPCVRNINELMPDCGLRPWRQYIIVSHVCTSRHGQRSFRLCSISIVSICWHYPHSMCSKVCLSQHGTTAANPLLLQAWCCEPDGQKISIDCCSSGVRMRTVPRCQRT